MTSCTTPAKKDKAETPSVFIPYFPDLDIKQVEYTVNADGDIINITIPYWWFKAVLIYASDVEAAAQVLETR